MHRSYQVNGGKLLLLLYGKQFTSKFDVTKGLQKPIPVISQAGRSKILPDAYDLFILKLREPTREN